MIQKLRERSSSEGGFTLVELLVVMLILGLLAAIAIPSFFNQRDKAKDADAKESVRTAQTAIETYATDHGGKYVDSSNASPTAADLVAIEQTLNNADLQDPVTTADSYTVQVDSETGNNFRISRDNQGNLTYECDNENEAGCPDGGVWGQ
jgi:type IV pilus assembly protein PilA